MGLLFAFIGRERNEESDLYSSRACYYGPEVGRFVSEAPLGFAAVDQNLSRYVGNFPTRKIDPTGKEQEDEIYKGYNPRTWPILIIVPSIPNTLSAALIIRWNKYDREKDLNGKHREIGAHQIADGYTELLPTYQDSHGTAPATTETVLDLAEDNWTLQGSARRLVDSSK